MTPSSMVALIHFAKKAHGRAVREAQAAAAFAEVSEESQVA